MKPTITHDEWYELCNQLSEAQEKLAGKDAYIEGQNDSFALMMEGRTELQKQLSEANARNASLVALVLTAPIWNGTEDEIANWVENAKKEIATNEGKE